LRSYNLNENWKTPVRATVRTLRQEGASYGYIIKKTSLSRSTIQHIIKAYTSWTTYKGKANKSRILKEADIKRIFRFISESWTNRTKSWARVMAKLWLEASIITIHHHMKAHGYCRYVACKWPFISKKQAIERLTFTLKY
jgi:hypothetical protein